MAKNTSQHILNTSANLLGFCLFVITSFHISDKAQNSRVDEFTSVIAFFLSVSCIVSFFAIRSASDDTSQKLETIADYFFIASLLGILLVIVFITLKFIR